MGKKYTKEEIKYLQENWQSKSIIEMAKHLGREQKALGRKLSYLGFVKDIAKNITTEYRDYAEIRVLTDTLDIASKIDIEDIPQWIKDKIDRRLESAGVKCN